MIQYWDPYVYAKGDEVEHPKFPNRTGRVVLVYPDGTADVMWKNSSRPYGPYEPGELRPLRS